MSCNSLDESFFVAPPPLERPDGHGGTHRGARETAQLAARHDLDAVRAWLSNYADTKTTLEAYRKEAERLLLWAVVQLGKPLSLLTHEDQGKLARQRVRRTGMAQHQV
jgi:hypothetical protein